MESTTPPRVLTIAGTDSGGGAGVAADLRAMTACGVHGCLAVTAVTVQNSLGVTGVHTLPPETVAAQIEAVATDIGLDAAKTGMLATSAIITAVAAACDRVGIGADGPTPFVVDPVAASMHGEQLLADEALDAFRSLLFPRATLLTPNLDEVRLLVGIDVHDRAAQYEAAKLLHALGPRFVLVKGGHLREDTDVCVDLLYDGHTFTELPGPRFATTNTHGGGDAMASAIASGLARGMAVPDAVVLGKRYITEAVRHAYPLGAGHGPVSPLWAVDRWWER
ncbi:MAG TPA: bifunctional hydroxymethylpyrimidine kinase/phosphomethylpyrimidine kinase [Pseudonocardia sp.]|nr:bifunctional hydroxymethylpyrimidine kinase/phosphomethylpyrimidine kinase [Pseudonocardia sp.]